MSNSSIWPIYITVPGATILGQCGPRSNGNEGVLHISHISNVGASLSDGFVSISGHSLEGAYSSAEMQSV